MVTAIAWAAPVPDTGQTKCYNNGVEITCPSPGQAFYGQDANYSINPLSYTNIYQTVFMAENFCAANILKIQEILFIALNSPPNNHILMTRRKT